MNTARPDNNSDIYNVTRLNREVRAVLEGSFPSIRVQGEISNLASPASGHLYFTLKDSYSQVRCAMFKGRNRHLACKPENGMEVLVRANISLYETRGEFQLLVDYMEPAGAGALQRAFELLKQKLAAEGLFADTGKKPLPALVECIGIITSPSGAAVRDILTVLRRRFPLARVIVYPTPVQGETAAAQIIDRLRTAERRAECDVILLARGGGSLEDLWAFNDENLARAIHACRLPVVTGIGHEIDITIADFVADQRAATPSAAAELISPDRQQLLTDLQLQRARLARQMQQLLQQKQLHSTQLAKRLPRPARILQMIQQRLDDLGLRCERAMHRQLTAQQGRLQQARTLLAGRSPLRLLQQHQLHNRQLQQALARQLKLQLQNLHTRLRQLSHNLETVSPLATLKRGYSIVRMEDGRIVRRATELQDGQQLQALFAEGQAELTVARIGKKKKTGFQP